MENVATHPAMASRLRVRGGVLIGVWRIVGRDFSSPGRCFRAPMQLAAAFPLKCALIPELPVPTTLLQSNLPGLTLIHRGKVRDVYALSERELLIVASDRLSAFDLPPLREHVGAHRQVRCASSGAGDVGMVIELAPSLCRGEWLVGFRLR